MKKKIPIALAALAMTPLFAQRNDTAEIGRIYRDTPHNLDTQESDHQLAVSLNAAHVFSLGSDAKGQKGYGFAAELCALPDKENSDWQFKMGAEIYAFSTSADIGTPPVNREESVFSAQIFLNIGTAYALGKHVEIGGLVGVGTGLSIGQTKFQNDTDRNGNWNYALQIKPQILVHVSENFDLHATYRIAHIGPFYATDLVGYKTVRMFHQSIEIGASWRF